MKTPRKGNPRRLSKSIKREREEKRLRTTFGENSPQYKHYLASREGKKLKH